MSKANKILNIINESTASTNDYKLLATLFRLLLSFEPIYKGDVFGENFPYDQYVTAFNGLGTFCDLKIRGKPPKSHWGFHNYGIKNVMFGILEAIKNVRNSGDFQGMDPDSLHQVYCDVNGLYRESKKRKKYDPDPEVTRRILILHEEVIYYSENKEVNEELYDFIDRFTNSTKKLIKYILSNANVLQLDFRKGLK